MSTGRLETFADGVFAIAATLLILNVGLDGRGSLEHQLIHNWVAYAGYAVSFLTVVGVFSAAASAALYAAIALFYVGAGERFVR